MLRRVREVDPARPSTKVSTADGLPGIAANRAIEPGHLGRSLRGDLDWIVMKALEKDRARRHESANGLADDIERHPASDQVGETLSLMAESFIANPKDTILSMKVAAWQACLGQDKEFAATRRRILAHAEGTSDPTTAGRAAEACRLVPTAGQGGTRCRRRPRSSLGGSHERRLLSDFFP